LLIREAKRARISKASAAASRARVRSRADGRLVLLVLSERLALAFIIVAAIADELITRRVAARVVHAKAAHALVGRGAAVSEASLAATSAVDAFFVAIVDTVITSKTKILKASASRVAVRVHGALPANGDEICAADASRARRAWRRVERDAKGVATPPAMTFVRRELG